jgi:hypothetical protein
VKKLLIVLTLVCGLLAQAAPADLAYFQQFTFKKVPIGNDPDFPDYNYHFLGTDMVTIMVPMQNGRFFSPTANIFLYDDGTYLIRYRENIFENPDDQFWFPGVCKNITGQWSVPGKVLVMEGVGIGERAVIWNNQNGVRITFDQDLGSSGLIGKTVEAGKYQSTSQDPTRFPCM